MPKTSMLLAQALYLSKTATPLLCDHLIVIYRSTKSSCQFLDEVPLGRSLPYPDHEAIRDRLGELDVLLNQHDGHFQFLVQVLNEFLNLCDDVRLNPFRGLIQDQKRWVGSKGAGDRELLRCPLIEFPPAFRD